VRLRPPGTAHPATDGFSPGPGACGGARAIPSVTEHRHGHPQAPPGRRLEHACIARAVSFTAVFIRSPKDGGNVIVQAATLAQAFTAADALNAAHGRWGRRACVYAIDPVGLTHFVDPCLRP
jgi:hypothetical protein